MEDEGWHDMPLSQAAAAPASEPLDASAYADADRLHGKYINDPIHKTFRLGPTSMKIVDSPQFQRLRDLKQLGLSYLVFPGASHNRFEHSLGVAHLAHDLAYHFMYGQSDLDLTVHDLKLVEIAGLCHDLGHGPFSHVFDYGFLRRMMGITNWSHEEMSVKILDTIIEDKGLLNSDLSQEDVDRIKAMILAGSKGAKPEATGKQFLHEIVANGRNGLDVDKYDYLERDALHCGVKTLPQMDRLRIFSKVINGEICHRWSEFENVQAVFSSRAHMHKQVYGHRAAKAIDLMIVDILHAANPVLRITDKIWDAREFVKLDDTILKQIEFLDLESLSAENRVHMEKAQTILKRFRERKLYKYCGDWPIPSSLVKQGWKQPQPSKIFEELQPGSLVEIDDILLMTMAIDYTAGSKHPLESVRFFNNWESKASYNIKPEAWTSFIYESYEERSLRVYSRKSDEESRCEIRNAADAFVKRTYGESVVCKTPLANRVKRSGSELNEPARRKRLCYGTIPEQLPNGHSHDEEK